MCTKVIIHQFFYRQWYSGALIIDMLFKIIKTPRTKGLLCTVCILYSCNNFLKTISPNTEKTCLLVKILKDFMFGFCFVGV